MAIRPPSPRGRGGGGLTTVAIGARLVGDGTAAHPLDLAARDVARLDAERRVAVPGVAWRIREVA